MRYRFNLRSLLVAIAVSSWVAACCFLPGAVYLHLPIAVLAALAAVAIHAAWRLWTNAESSARRPGYRLLISIVLFVIVGALYFPVFGLAVSEARRAEASRLAASQKLTLQKIGPIPVRDAAMKLHERLKGLPVEERRLDGESDVIPSEIAALHPRHVMVDQDTVFVEICCTTDDWFGLLIFAGNAPEHGDIKLADGIWYWETP